MTSLCSTLSLTALLLLLAPAAPAFAGRVDHEQARKAVASGQIAPLRALLERMERDHPGQILEIELEQKGSRWIYEIKLLQRNGQLTKLKLNASDLTEIEREQSKPRSD